MNPENEETFETDGEPVIADAILEEIPTKLTERQQARVEALFNARSLITADSTPAASTGFMAAIGTIGGDRLLGRPQNIAIDLTTIAEYIIGNDPSFPFGGNVLVGVQFVDIERDAPTCDREGCACKIAAEFTGGEADMPAPEPVAPEGWLAPDAPNLDSEELDTEGDL